MSSFDTPEECTCHISPPCGFCTSLTEEEVDIYTTGGVRAVRDHRRNERFNDNLLKVVYDPTDGSVVVTKP